MNFLKNSWIIRSFRKTSALCFLSALLLAFAFPKISISVLAFFALVPLFFALDNKNYRESFSIGYLFGVLFFLMIFYWIMYTVSIAVLLLVFYLAFYPAIFALGYRFLKKQNPLIKAFVLPSLWVCLEFMRAHLFSGLGWASIGHSQSENIIFIQIADITGVYGISFVLVMFNLALKEILTDLKENKKYKIMTLGVAFLFVCLCFFYGYYRIQNIVYTDQIRVSVVQGSVEQERKWNYDLWPAILNDYFDLTRAAAKTKPDIIIWPETAYPGFMWENPKRFVNVQNFVRVTDFPVLIGVITRENDSYFNSAILLDSSGEAVKRHDKLHLVPFGEYLPFRKEFPWLGALVPFEDFQTGKEYTLFSSYGDKGKRNPFGVLICFEDTIAELSRNFVLKGAKFLVNITNDGWFEDSSEPFLHAQNAIFRSVENKVPLIRAANTGVSGFINAVGQMYKTVQDSSGRRTYVSGFATANVYLTEEKTFYTKFGDIFTYLCFGVILVGAAIRLRRN